MMGDATGQGTRPTAVRATLLALPEHVERLGWLLVFVGAPLGNTTVGMAVLLLGALGRLAGRQKLEWGLPRFDPFYTWGGIFLGITVISALLSERPSLGLAVSLAYFLMIFLMARGSAVFFRAKPFLNPVLATWILILSGIVGAAYGLYTYFGLGRARATGVAVTVNGLGTVSAFMALIGFAYFLYAWRRSRSRAGVALLMALLSTATLVVTYSRGAWLAFAFSLALFAALVIWRQGRRMRIGAGIVLLVMVLVGAGLFISEPRLQTRLLSAFSLEANDDRTTIWVATVDMIQDHPLFGVGGGSFTHVYEEYRTRGRHAMAFAHNLFLQSAAEFGLLGMAAFSIFLGIALIRGWQVARRGNVLHQGLFCGYLSILLHEMVDNITYGMNVGGLFWFVTGLLVHLHYEMKKAWVSEA